MGGHVRHPRSWMISDDDSVHPDPVFEINAVVVLTLGEYSDEMPLGRQSSGQRMNDATNPIDLAGRILLRKEAEVELAIRRPQCWEPCERWCGTRKPCRRPG